LRCRFPYEMMHAPIFVVAIVEAGQMDATPGPAIIHDRS
jgi:hypothetical protein